MKISKLSRQHQSDPDLEVPKPGLLILLRPPCRLLGMFMACTYRHSKKVAHAGYNQAKATLSTAVLMVQSSV